MIDDINLRNTDVLNDLSIDIQRTASNVEEVFQSVDSNISSAVGQIENRINYWKVYLDQLYYERNRCYQRELADCSEIEAEIRNAKEKLTICYQCLEDLNYAVEEYKSFASRTNSTIKELMPPALHYLNEVRSTVEDLITSSMMISYVLHQARRFPNYARGIARRGAQKQEMELVNTTGHGTREWSTAEKDMMKKGSFPKDYQAHHINSLQRFPDLAYNPDNITFFTKSEHIELGHKGDFHNASSGKMYNRKSMMVQWRKRNS